MSQVTKDAQVNPEGQTSDAEVVSFRPQSESRSVLDQLIREGAQRMLQAAIEAEVDEFLSLHAGRCDEAGRRYVVRNGHLPSRAIATGAGRLEVTQPRVRVSHPFRFTLSELDTIVPAGVIVIAAVWLRAGRMIEGRRAAMLMGAVIGASYRVSFIGMQPVGPYEIYFFLAFVGGGGVGAMMATVESSGWQFHQVPQRP